MKRKFFLVIILVIINIVLGLQIFSQDQNVFVKRDLRLKYFIPWYAVIDGDYIYILGYNETSSKSVIVLYKPFTNSVIYREYGYRLSAIAVDNSYVYVGVVDGVESKICNKHLIILDKQSLDIVAISRSTESLCSLVSGLYVLLPGEVYIRKGNYYIYCAFNKCVFLFSSG